jgi:hypothetical protein
MKKPVMQRAMFVGMTPKSESKGILSGFDEEMEDYEERTPENLEIIANNLRGDIRSMDERYLELASLVGEAAFETPEEVVALMQAQMAQQPPEQDMAAPPAGGGIASLGQAPAMPEQPAGIMGMAQPEMPQEEMPPQAMPMDQEPQPIGLARGGDPGAMLRAAQDAEMLNRFYNFAGQSRLSPVQLQQTAPMTGFLSGEGARFLQSGAAAPGGQLPAQIPTMLRASTMASESMRNIAPYTRELGRVLMGTPQGKTAMGIGAAGMAALPFLTGSSPEQEGGPIYSEVPGVDASGRYQPVLQDLTNMPGTPEQREAVANMGLTDITPRLGMADLGAGPAPEEVLGVEGQEAPAPVTPAGRVATGGQKPPAPTPKTFKERVKDKIDIYKDVLGDDENMRQAQALFLLAESALNVAGATGRSTGERLAKGLKGLPAGMAALGAEKSKQDLAVRSAALSAVEGEMAAESKSATQLMLKMMDANAKGADTREIANYLVGAHGFTPEKADQVAKLSKAGAIKTNDAGEMVDLTGRIIHSPFKLVEGDVGYLPSDGKTPFVSVGKQSLVPATAKDRPALAAEMANNQSLINSIERVYAMPSFESAYGPMARIQSGATSILTPFFGSNVPFTDLAKDVQLNIAMDLRNELVRLSARNADKPSVWEQKRIEKYVGDPKAILNSPDEFFGILNNFRVKAINRVNEIDHQLNGTPLKQLEYTPMGTAKEPLQAKDSAYLGEFFRLRPNGAIFIQLPGERAPRKFTAQEWYKQTGQQ